LPPDAAKMMLCQPVAETALHGFSNLVTIRTSRAISGLVRHLKQFKIFFLSGRRHARPVFYESH
jgi:hypothetical protein